MTNQTDTQVTIKRLEGPADSLLHIYGGQGESQDCYIALDVRDGTMWADYNGEIGNAVPATVYHGLVRRYPIPTLQPATVNTLMEEIAPLAQRVLDGSEVVWDGSNHVARLDWDAQKAEIDICGGYAERDAQSDEFYENEHPVIYPEMESDVFWWEAADWIEPERSEVREMLSSRSVDEVYDDLQGDGSSDDRPVLVGLRDYLTRLAGAAD